MGKKKYSKYKKYSSLDNILKARYHGAVNIRGIRYQILFSIHKTLEEYTNNVDFEIHLEGIEDLDLKGLNFNNKYFQAKTSEYNWNWAKYKEVFKLFYEIYSLNNKAQFYLVTNFLHNIDWIKLTDDCLLTSKEEQRLENKVKKINNDIGIVDYKFYKNIKLITLNEEELSTSINKRSSEIYSISSEKMASIFIDSIFSKFLVKAQERGSVTKHFIDDIWSEINESLSRQHEFSAFGDGLISKLEWELDDKEDDFFDGKKVRPSHIQSQLDVPRRRWVDQIDKAINGSNVCIIKASSGQGKSTLLYRYAHDFWDEKYIYVLKSVQSTKEVELVKNFLKYLKKIDFPILLLIDNADFQTALWPDIAGFCSGIGIRVLVTTRNEDWFRFSNPNVTNYEIIQPDLDIDEAKEIYKVFSKRNRIHENVLSYQWAFEKIGKPHLLIEYVYLLTHGEMLKERLERQIKHISEKEDKVKIELLRLISSADSLGSPLNIKKTLKAISFGSDPQNIIKSLEGEYIEIANGYLQGLHWVRSQHLTQLLHGEVIRITDTVIRLLELIPETNLAYFISNCIVHEQIDNDEILNNINSNIEKYSLIEIEEIIRGLFLGGERIFFIGNKAHFEKAFDVLGHSGVSLLGMSTTPTNMINAIENLSAIKTNDTIEKLKSILLKITGNIRGVDLCLKFAGLIETKRILNKLTKDSLFEAPNIFYWLKFAGIKIDTSLFIKQFVGVQEFEKYDEKSIYRILSGLYEYNQNEYFKWYRKSHSSFHSFLKYKTETLELKLENNELSIDFIQLNDDLSPNEQAMSRLEKYREALPFCLKYSSHEINLLPFNLEPSVRDTEKTIPVANLPLNFYVKLNRYWLDILENTFLPDSFYSFEESHYKLREYTINYIEILVSFFKHTFIKKKYNIEKAFLKDNLFENIKILLDTVPDPPRQCEERIREQFKKLTRNSQTHFRNFFYQFIEYFNQERNKKTGRLALHNLKDYLKSLPDLYNGFDLVSSISMDYFGIRGLREKEIKQAEKLIDIFEFYNNNWSRIPIYNYEVQIKSEKELINSQIVQEVKSILADKNVIIADHVFLDHPLSYLPLYFTVNNPVFPEKELEELLPLFKEAKYKPSFYYLIPIYYDELIIEGGYRISSTFDVNDFTWESLVPLKIPEKIKEILPVRKKSYNKEFSFKNDLIGCVGLIYVWIKQSDLIKIKEEEDDYYIVKLYNKMIDKYLNTHKELKEFFENIYSKYNDVRDDLQQTFIVLDLNEIFRFVDSFIQIEKHDKAMVFIVDNIYVWESIVKYFGLINDE